MHRVRAIIFCLIVVSILLLLAVWGLFSLVGGPATPSVTPSVDDRLSVLQTDDVWVGLEPFLGKPTDGATLDQCMGPDFGSQEPDVWEDFGDPYPTPSKATADISGILRSSGWTIDTTQVIDKADDYVGAHKRFASWTSSASISIGTSLIEVELDALSPERCPQ